MFEQNGITMRDYYEILGVSKDASAAEMKSKYRKLAIKYHPDRNPNDKEAEAKFKKINEAYAVLSNKEKRKHYDTFGSSQFHQQYTTEDIFQGFDFNNIFSEFGNGQQSGFDGIFQNLFGHKKYQQRKPKGQNIEYPLTISFHNAYTGCDRQISYRLPSGAKKQFKVTIPAGIQNKSKLRVAGKGALSNCGVPGDLYITVNIDKHPLFCRVENNIEVNLTLKLTEALLGTIKQIETPQGKKKTIIPAGIQAGTKIRLKDLGFPNLKQPQQRGALFAKIIIALPKVLTPLQKKLLEQLKELGL